MYYGKIIAKRIYELRLEHGYTQKQLAEIIGVTPKAIDFWEKGTNEPKASFVAKLAKTFKVTADYILGLEN